VKGYDFMKGYDFNAVIEWALALPGFAAGLRCRASLPGFAADAPGKTSPPASCGMPSSPRPEDH
jgi:hypothetical protein